MESKASSNRSARSIGRLVTSSAILVALTIPSTPLFAQESPRPVSKLVKLRSGTTLQGELVEDVPGDHVTIRLATGEIRTVSARDLVTSSDVAMPAVTITTVTVGAATTEAHADADGATVRVDTHAPTDSLPPLVSTPGDDQVGRTYDVDAPTFVPPPTVPTWAPPILSTRAEAKRSATRTAAWISIAAGTAIALPGLYMVTRSSGPSNDPGPDAEHIVGIDLLGIALPAIVTGIVLFSTSGSPSPTGASSAVEIPRPPSVALGGGVSLGASGLLF